MIEPRCLSGQAKGKIGPSEELKLIWRIEMKPPKKITFFIDAEKFETSETELSVRTLLIDFAEEDPNTTTLVLKESNELRKLTNLNELIPMKNGMKFFVYHNDPTPVSFGSTSEIYGSDRLKLDLVRLGFNVTIMLGSDGQNYAVIHGFEIQSGLFKGRVVDVGIMAVPNYPQGVASAIQVRAKPQLFENTDSISGVRNIQPSPLGDEWRYWSKNFNWAAERTTRRLVSQINRIFEDA
jgi:hypothetical protein